MLGILGKRVARGGIYASVYVALNFPFIDSFFFFFVEFLLLLVSDDFPLQRIQSQSFLFASKNYSSTAKEVTHRSI